MAGDGAQKPTFLVVHRDQAPAWVPFGAVGAVRRAASAAQAIVELQANELAACAVDVGLPLAVELLEGEGGPVPGRDQFFERRDAQRMLCRIVVHIAKQHDAPVRHRLRERRRGGFDACGRALSRRGCSVQARGHGDDQSGQGEE